MAKDQRKPAGKDFRKKSGAPGKPGKDKGKKFDKDRKFGKDKPSREPGKRSSEDQPFWKKTRPEKTFDKRPGSRPEKYDGSEEKRPTQRPQYGSRRPAKMEERSDYRSNKRVERSHEAHDEYAVTGSDAGYGRENEAEESTTLIIKGRHEVLNALEGKEKIESVYISSSVKGPVPAKLRELASKQGVPVKELKAENFERKFGEKSQGVAALAGAFAYLGFEKLIEKALAGKQVLVALNQVEDPRNLGAIVRTVEAAGCSGLIIPKHRSAGMTEWAIRTAQGAAAHLPVSRVTNLGDAITTLKERGFWVVGLDESADKNYTQMVYSGPTLLVAGGEDAGLGERVKNCCDDLVAIPISGKTTSLNVSVSTAVVLFEICRQKEFF